MVCLLLLHYWVDTIAEGMFNTRSLNSLVFVVYCLLEATSALQEFFRPILSKTVDWTTHKKNTTSTYGDNYYRGRNWINILCNVIAKPFLQAASYDLVVLTFHDEHVKSAALPEELWFERESCLCPIQEKKWEMGVPQLSQWIYCCCCQISKCTFLKETNRCNEREPNLVANFLETWGWSFQLRLFLVCELIVCLWCWAFMEGVWDEVLIPSECTNPTTQ